VILSSLGVSVTRHYLKPDLFNPLGAETVFWQEGMGTVSGPLLELSGVFWNCCVNDTIQYDISNSGLPGGVGSCSYLSQSVHGLQNGFESLIPHPNPSTAQFTFNLQQPKHIVVYDAFGREILQTFGSSVDLSGEPEEVYVARVFSNSSVNSPQVVRLVVAR